MNWAMPTAKQGAAVGGDEHSRVRRWREECDRHQMVLQGARPPPQRRQLVLQLLDRERIIDFVLGPEHLDRTCRRRAADDLEVDRDLADSDLRPYLVGLCRR